MSCCSAGGGRRLHLEQLLARKGLKAVNQEAVSLLRSQDAGGAVEALDFLLSQLTDKHVAIPDVYICFGNRSAAQLALGNTTAAVQDAITGLRVAEQQCKGIPTRRHPGYAGVMRRLGDALLASGRLLLAQDAYAEALVSDPTHLGARNGLQDALEQQCHQQEGAAPSASATMDAATASAEQQQQQHPELLDLVNTCHDALSLTPAVASHVMLQMPHMPFSHQLTPKQAEVDVVTRDTLNYLTIQSDIQIPRHLLCNYLQDAVRMQALAAAMHAAVTEMTQIRGQDCRVVCLGAGLGLVPLLALRAGATHVTVIERWMYAALAAQELLQQHEVPPEQYTVLHGKAMDMDRSKVPVCVNLVVAEAMLDSGLLTSGLTASVRHIMSHLAIPEAIVIPKRLHVWCQVAEMKSVHTGCSATLDALDMHQADSLPEGLLPGPQGSKPLPLTSPLHIWTFSCHDMSATPQARSVATQACTSGLATAVECWYQAELFGDICWSSGGDGNPRDPHDPHTRTAVATSLHPVVHALRVVVPTVPGQTLQLLAVHNTAKLAFSCTPAAPSTTDVLQPRSSGGGCTSNHCDQSTEGFAALASGAQHLATHVFEDASLPRSHFRVAADTVRLHVYQAAIQAAVKHHLRNGTPVHTLDLKSGRGSHGIMAAQAGSEVVMCVEEHPTLASIARRNAALSAVSAQVCVVQGTPEEAARCLPAGWPKSGCNLVTLDIHSPDLFRSGVISCLAEAVKRGLVSTAASVVPAKVVIYCMGVELLSRAPAGVGCERLAACAGQMLAQVDLSALNKYGWSDEPECLNLADTPHVRLTPSFALWELDLAGFVSGGDVVKQAPPVVTPHIPKHSSEASAGHSSYFVKQGGGGGLMLQAAATAHGVLNAVVFWFDLHVDEHHVITTAPADIGLGGVPLGAVAGPSSSNSQRNDVGRLANCSQIVQYTQHVQAVQPGELVQLVAQRQPDLLVVNVRPSKGMPAPRPPWKEEWGGGSSVENPHVQRVKYCELLEADLLQRLPCGRGPSVEEDIRRLAEHCGSLMLHAPAVRSTLGHFSLLERLYRPGHQEPRPSDAWATALLATDDEQNRCRPDVRVSFSPEVVSAVNWRHVQGTSNKVFNM